MRRVCADQPEGSWQSNARLPPSLAPNLLIWCAALIATGLERLKARRSLHSWALIKGWDYALAMDEMARFETRAVLAPRRARRARLALLVPVGAFVAIAWVGLSGDHGSKAAADVPHPTTAAPSPVPTEAPFPARVLGLAVRRLDDVQPVSHVRDYEFAILGWYVPTSITDCPPFAIVYRDGALPEIRRDVDALAYCDRTGILYASPPDPDLGKNGGLKAVAVTVVLGVVMPSELETVGTDATQVVVLGRFVPSGENCDVSPGCGPELMVDHVGWTPGA